jgi:uncharacterized protein (TIGR02996 family)
MSLRDAFLKVLADNEDDTTTRLVYADWLDEQGEHEEADRQRRWPAAKEWLVRFCKDASQDRDITFTYDSLLAFGRQVVKEDKPSDRIHLEEDLWYALRQSSQGFWMNWSIVTGIPLPPSFENRGFHRWSCCPTENYYWFGAPDESDPEE